jgi:hypothetical protein
MRALPELAEMSNGVPEEDMSLDAWKAILNNMAAGFRMAYNEEYFTLDNEQAKDCLDEIDFSLYLFKTYFMNLWD